MRKPTAARVLPPVLYDAARKLRARREVAEWEYLPGASSLESSSGPGWGADAILREQVRKWADFAELTTGPGSLGIDHHAVDLTNRDYRAHNIVMSFGYVLALASREKSTISLLDWGSGIGHYALFARALLPEVRVDYHGVDFPALVEEGRRVLPEATFLDTRAELDRSYDLVVASGALQYADPWPSKFAELLRAAGSFTYVVTTVVRHAPSFVVVQRPYKYGYDTDLTQWMINRDELVSVAEENDFSLRREFLNEEMAPIEGAPERGATVGFLFERSG